MKRLLILFLLFGSSVLAQNAKHKYSKGTSKAISPQDPAITWLVRVNETPFLPSEKTEILNYIETLTPKVTGANFNTYYLYVTIADGYSVFDLMEGLKTKGFSFFYYDGHKGYRINDELKVEAWDIK